MSMGAGMGGIFGISAMGMALSSTVAMLSFFMYVVQAENTMLNRSGRMIEDAAKG